MTLFTGEMSGAAAAGSQQTAANGMTENTEGSLFQQMINQMLTAQNQTAVAASGSLNPGEQNKSEGTGNMLSELLLAGGNLSKTGLLKTAMIAGETAAESKEASGEKQPVDENAEATEMLQALMAGMTNTATAVNVDKAFIGIQTEKSAVSQLASVSAAVAAHGDPAANQILEQTAGIPQSGMSGAEIPTGGKAGSTEAAEGMNVVQQGIRQNPEEQKQMTQTASSLESKISLSEKAEAANGNQALEKTVLTNGEAEKQTAFASQSLQTLKAENGNQTEASEILIQEESAVSAEKPRQETAADSGIDPARSGFQNSVQGAVTTVEIPGSVTQNQDVESPQPYSQIREEILNKLEQNGPTEFKMQLEPEDLGQIDIKLKLSEGKLIIDILAADSRTQALLTSQVDKLISSMGLQNVQVESVQVSQQMNSQAQDNSQGQGFTMNSAMDFSQRRQEQNRQEIFNNGNLAGTFSSQQDETKADETIGRIESARFNSHRMNYTI
jgi:flagellar hook-length control protein FliK